MEDMGGGMLFPLIMLAFTVFIVAAVWRVFTKAGKPGWAALIPIYNAVVLLEITGRPLWWLLLFFVPVMNVIAMVIVGVDLARSFGKGVGFGIGLSLFGFIFYPILGFGSARYEGATAA